MELIEALRPLAGPILLLTFACLATILSLACLFTNVTIRTRKFFLSLRRSKRR